MAAFFIDRDAAKDCRVGAMSLPVYLFGDIPRKGKTGMGKKYKGIIFDLDGVICFTDKYHYKAWKMIADKLGFAFDEVKNNRLRGVSRMASLEIVLEDSKVKYSEEEKLAFATEKNDFYRELLKEMSPADLSDEVKNTLVELRKRGIKLAIGSSSKNARFILDRIGLGDFFDEISDGNNITHSKPDPEVFLCAAEYLGLAPSDCLVVEDAVAGIEAATAGGFDSAALGDARTSNKSTYKLESFSGLLSI